jgi:predicted TIM-barrel fold metal-dependent hydrolase
MIIDTHLHYWQRPTPERPHDPDGIHWGEEMLAEDLLKELDKAGVSHMVQVTASLMGNDNRYSLEAAAAHHDRVVGVFGRFDPLLPDNERRLKDFMAQEGMIGVRITLHQPPYDTWLREGRLNDFLAAVEKLSIPLELFAPYQTAELHDILKRYPGIRIMLDHMGLRRLPQYKDNWFWNWPDILRLGEESNIWMKVSYFPEAAPSTEKYPFPTAKQRFRELYDHIGPGKMIWGSNYPPVLRACSYAESVDFIRSECDFLSEADRSAIFAGNFIKYIKQVSGRDLFK